MASQSILSVDGSKRREKSWRPWSDLPEDLLRPVVERLSPVDRICFRAVCKNWLVSPIRNDVPTLPWIMYYSLSPRHAKCSFIEPCRKLPIMEEERRWDDEVGWITAESMLYSARACASRCGWVLFSTKIREVFCASLCHVYQHYVYHPLSKEIISLPRLELGGYGHGFENLAIFTSEPTSLQCVFLVPTVCKKDGYFFIRTYSIGDKTWKTHNARPHPYFSCVHGVAYMDGRVYCYNENEGLSSFHIATQEWRLLSNEATHERRLLSNERPLINYWNHIEKKSYFVAYGGHLHLVYLTKSRDDKVLSCEIFRYDWSDGAWKKMESLEGGALFLGEPSFGVSAGEQTKMVANRVYYFSSQTSSPRFLVYGSAATGEEPESSGNKIYCESWPEERKSWGESRSCIWMEPPSFKC